MSKEIDFERKAIKELRELPLSYWPDKVDPGAIRGLPDRVGCVNGLYIALEFKRSIKDMGDSREELQSYVMKKVREAGGFASYAYPENWQLLIEEIREWAGV